ncbi:related to CHL1 - protein of the DEAH box family [Cephalotrichum gorgonifer]|uniref:ATP-dependent DNA helicase CHL1 n=1 Tax=Cephalotrichum gorgonifer TaxID=2041049 RepID=A0AAE8N610_9PEZI|nr:related to CHL1 - protein of the DEAH box family [Cephalotrichum gorgonifer]
MSTADQTAPPSEGTGGGPADFNHPYTPYDVQVDFMKTVYGVLQAGDGQVGILESPTGTGKSLSLICASLTWLRNFKASAHETTLKSLGEKFAGEPDWVVEQLLRRKRDELTRQWEEREERLESIRQKERAQEARRAKRRRVEEGGSELAREAVDEDAEWLLDDWEDRDAQGGSDPLSGLSAETRDILSRMGMGPKKTNPEDDKLDDEIKIFYASRTHSQLSQFISELRRPSFPSSYPSHGGTASTGEGREGEGDGERIPAPAAVAKEHVKHIPLSSRQKLCINPSVSRLGSLSAINDRCAELQQSKTKAKCQYLPGEETLTQTRQFRDTALATLPDIEDLHALGKSLSVCPYYASRAAIPASEIITLPYPLLLQKSARDALGIKLEGNVVIIDEAHNVMDAVSGVNAAAIRLSELRRARQMLAVYVRKFGKKLKGENRVMVGRVGRVIEGLSEWLEGAMKGKGEQEGIVDSNALLRHKSIDQINMFKLVQYIQDSKLAYKIESYVSHIEEDRSSSQGPAAAPRSATPVLHTLLSFLLALTNLSFEGRIFYQKDPSSTPGGDIQLSYLLLSPTHAFSSITSSARAVILAGGTMSPFEDYTAHLFPSLPGAKVTTLSCGHVIPSSNLSVWTLSKYRTPTGGESPFEFSFQRRGDKDMISQLGLALVNICSVVPDGVVVFLPSYGYLDEVVRAWQASPVWDRLSSKKVLFRESKGGSSDEVLESYSAAILSPAPDKPRGALLLSVVGGKMSEGINFSDRLGRCVLVVGLPYPNINSPEWKAKTEYVESTTASRLVEADPGVGAKAAAEEGKRAAREFYENACMRAVNQSIGRAIRHRGDYAAIILVDRRYGSERIRSKLPRWIASSMEGEEGLGRVMGGLSSFFRGKKV